MPEPLVSLATLLLFAEIGGIDLLPNASPTRGRLGLLLRLLDARLLVLLGQDDSPLMCRGWGHSLTKTISLPGSCLQQNERSAGSEDLAADLFPEWGDWFKHVVTEQGFCFLKPFFGQFVQSFLLAVFVAGEEAFTLSTRRWANPNDCSLSGVVAQAAHVPTPFIGGID